MNLLSRVVHRSNRWLLAGLLFSVLVMAVPTLAAPQVKTMTGTWTCHVVIKSGPEAGKSGVATLIVHQAGTKLTGKLIYGSYTINGHGVIHGRSFVIHGSYQFVSATIKGMVATNWNHFHGTFTDSFGDKGTFAGVRK